MNNVEQVDLNAERTQKNGFDLAAVVVIHLSKEMGKIQGAQKRFYNLIIR